MRVGSFVSTSLIPLLYWFFTITPLRADTHIYAGALGTSQNDKLYFSNGFLFDATQTNYAFPQILRTNGLNIGFYKGDALTFSALAGDIPNHAALGSRLAIQVVGVQGPVGGVFAFWEGDGESDLGKITFSASVGTTDGSNYLIISENNGEPGSDPYGHFHGRVFTTSVPGTYTVGFRVIDVSTNGVGGGPIHSPSDVLQVRFQAGLRLETLQVATNRVTASFRSPPAISNVLEAAISVDGGAWTMVAGPVRGNNSLQSLTETNVLSRHRFYRLRTLNNLP